MHNKIKHLFLGGALVSTILTFVAPVAYAAPQACQVVQLNLLKCDSNGGDPVTSLVLQVINFLAIGVGVVVVGGITYGALLYTTSNGDSGKAQQGITTIVNAVIGLLLFIFTYAIINYLIPGGVF